MLAVENYSLPDNNDRPKVIVYDVEYDNSYSLNLQLRFLKSLDGITQINFNNKLFLCGASEEDNLGGSYLICFDPVKATTIPMINSIYHHYYPTICAFHSTNILVVGGKNSVKCELFNTETSKWKYLPDLPSVRYGCTGFVDVDNEYVYLFGGYNPSKFDLITKSSNLDTSVLTTDSNFKGKVSNLREKSDSNTKNIRKNTNETHLNDDQRLTVLRIGLHSCICWEEVHISNSGDVLNKNFSVIINSSNSLIIFGGKTILSNESEDPNLKNKFIEVSSEDAIELNLEDLQFKSKLKLPRPMSFRSCRDAVNLNRGTFFLLDDEMRAIKLETNGFRLLESHLFK